jgi:hypothetical protein
MMIQKLEYIHNNPVQREWVASGALAVFISGCVVRGCGVGFAV